MSTAGTVRDRGDPDPPGDGSEPMKSDTESGSSRWQAVDLFEEAFGLLRRTPFHVHALHLLGTVPFVMMLGFFWSDMTRGSTAAAGLGGSALALSGAYFWMKLLQSLHGRAMLDLLRPEAARRRLGWMARGRQAAALTMIQSTSLIVQLFAATVVLPFAWVAAFYQNATVLGFARDWGRPALRKVVAESARLSHFRPAQNHFVLMIGYLFGLFVWVNVLLGMMLAPVVLRAFTGIESAFTRSPEAAFYNSTTLAVSMAVAFVLASPLFRAVFVLRCFYGLSERSGEDLWSAFHAARQERGAGGISSAGPIAAILLGVIALLTGMRPVAASDSTGTTAEEKGSVGEAASEGHGAPDRFERSLEQVLARREFQWRLPRQPIEADAQGERGGVAGFFDRLAMQIREAVRSVETTLKEFWDWLRGKRKTAGGSGGASGWSGAMAGIQGLRILVFSLLAIVGCALIWWMVRALAKRRREPAVSGAAGPPAIDLASEEVTAADLEEDAWIRLAQQKLDAGEERLAVRAVFLACLAHLGGRRMVNLQRFKSNRDYLRELRTRTGAEPGILDNFQASTTIFERVWYGDHAADRSVVGEIRGFFDRLRSKK